MLEITDRWEINYIACCSLNLPSLECSLGFGQCSPVFPCPHSCTWCPQYGLSLLREKHQSRLWFSCRSLCCCDPLVSRKPLGGLLCDYHTIWVQTWKTGFCRHKPPVPIRERPRWLRMVFNDVLFSSRGWVPLLPLCNAIQLALPNYFPLLEQKKSYISRASVVSSWPSECV